MPAATLQLSDRTATLGGAGVVAARDGSERLVAFAALPQSERDAAWRELRREVEARERKARAEVVA